MVLNVRLYVLLVIYNRGCEDSPACEGLRQTRDARVLVMDNSTEPNDNAGYCAGRGFGYLSMGGNKGLSKAYNSGIRWIKAYTDATHVMLLDDDTTLPDGFLERTAEAIGRNPKAAVFVPQVYDEIGLLSPSRIEGLRVSRIDDPAVLRAEDMTAINSGMALDLALFEDYTYDEGYFLDYIDHAFLRDMKARGVSFVVTKERLSQRFSGNERGHKKAAKIRLRIFQKDFRRFCGRSLKGRLTAEAVIMRRRLKLLLR